MFMCSGGRLASFGIAFLHFFRLSGGFEAPYLSAAPPFRGEGRSWAGWLLARSLLLFAICAAKNTSFSTIEQTCPRLQYLRWDNRCGETRRGSCKLPVASKCSRRKFSPSVSRRVGGPSAFLGQKFLYISSNHSDGPAGLNCMLRQAQLFLPAEPSTRNTDSLPF